MAQATLFIPGTVLRGEIKDAWVNVYTQPLADDNLAGIPRTRKATAEAFISDEAPLGYRIHVIPKINPRCAEVWR